MRGLRFAAALLVAVAVHVAGVRLLPAFPLAVDLFLVLAVFSALRGSALTGMLAGLAAGLVSDVLSGGLFGLYGLVDTILGYGAAFAAQRLVIQRAASAMLLFSLAAAAQQVLLMGLALMLMGDPGLPDLIWPLLKVATSALLGTALFVADTQLRGRYELWRRTRVTKIRMGR